MNITFRTLSLMAALLLSLSGCGKKDESAASSATAQPGAAAPAAENAGPGSGAVIDTKPVLAKVDSSFKAKEYDQAAEALLALQQQKLTEQQALEARNRMIQFQRDLAGAVASGDPKAKAAAEKLRAASTVR